MMLTTAWNRTIVASLCAALCMTTIPCAAPVAVAQAAESTTSAAYVARGECLTGAERALYDKLKEHVVAVAAGQEASTVFTIDASGTGIAATSAGRLNVNTDTVVSCLMADYPYEMFWYDKTSGYSVTGSADVNTTTIESLTMGLAVNDSYAKSGGAIASINRVECSVEVDVAKVSAAAKAASTAKQVVEQASGFSSNYEKLVYFKDCICNAASYDNQAASQAVSTYGNPWQLVSVFDGDSGTNSVCEGYSKAFQYLCNLAFVQSSDAACYCVGGTLSYSEKGQLKNINHMWNLVVLDGKSYLVDVTNSDSDAVAKGGELFLAGTANGSVKGGYTFAVGSIGDVSYAYDADTQTLYSSDLLKLASAGYATGASSEENVPKDQSISDNIDTTTVKLNGLNKLNKVVTFKIGAKAQGTLTYKLKSVPSKAAKYIKVSKNGKVTLKKGLKKGVYKLKVRIDAAATAGYKAASTVKTITVIVKRVK